MHTEAPWWNDFFDMTYAEFGLTVATADEERARDAAVDFIAAALGAGEGATILDQCCGIGRLSIPVARRGYRVIGVDQVSDYVQVATRAADAAGVSAAFFHGDARDFVSPEPCDAAYNWFTSFGYDRDDAQNARMLRCVFESLKPGGWFALDYVNVPRVMRDFRPSKCSRRPWRGGDLLVVEEAEIDFAAGTFETDWTYVFPDGTRRSRRVRTRTYMPSELVGLMTAAGFVDVALRGSVDGEPFSRESRRCIVLARRPT